MKRVITRFAIKSDAMQTDIAAYIRFYREAHSCHHYVYYYNIYLGAKLQFLHWLDAYKTCQYYVIGTR